MWSHLILCFLSFSVVKVLLMSGITVLDYVQMS
jgi:hypothetical protein